MCHVMLFSADVLGIVQSVGSIVMIRRKNSNEEIPKRDITIADERCLSLCASLSLIRYWIWSRCHISAQKQYDGDVVGFAVRRQWWWACGTTWQWMKGLPYLILWMILQCSWSNLCEPVTSKVFASACFLPLLYQIKFIGWTVFCLRLSIDIWLELTLWLPPTCSSPKSYSSCCMPGVSLSTTSNSMVAINPDIPEAIALRNWSVLC